MKKGIYLALSILSYGFSGLLIGIFLTQESPGMIMVFLIPLLILGMVSGILAHVMNRVTGIESNTLTKAVQTINKTMIVLGTIALTYVFLN